MPTLPIQPVVNVTYTIAPTGAVYENFDLGLIIGTSSVISTSTRVVVYTSLADMVTAGFLTNSPEYLAAALYFDSPGKPYQVAIGVQGTGETPLQAVTACRAANTNWYCCMVCSATDSDHEAIAAYIESLNNPYSTYFLTSSAAAVLNNTAGNLFATLKGSKYTRTFMLYSSTNYAAASFMGYAMGLTNDLPNSAYTLMFKVGTGITPEVLTDQQVLNIEGNNGNVYITRGQWTWLENGVMSDGGYFDTIIGTDKLTNEISVNVGNLLYQTPKVPQTERGMAELRTVIASACDTAVTRGFLAPGKWNGAQIMTLNTGDYLSAGYLILSESIDSQSEADRAARKCPPIYIPAKLAGAIQNIYIQVNINA